ncbi:uncharacterized zinc finger protein CG2678 [Drosophila eugracilis]|uniref:uncharacterized zinc finger protein CG2678 n=1 Tax=Drosophila eugracilis TaxID=29029 RepID=UPI001BDAC486|nr:uncharacterized zinc finger protein CG2678 [Drosophila eugracilis]XP_017076076.2 uncharacterized zinc finger protein CG2678 [Drosophila eugracilis]
MKKRCRVCMRNSKKMVNIFDGTQYLAISIPYMISECTGFKVEKGDSLPESICPPCLEDAQNAYKIIKTHERSYKIFCEVKDAILEDDLLEEEICLISDGDSERSQCPEDCTEDRQGKNEGSIQNDAGNRVHKIRRQNNQHNSEQADLTKNNDPNESDCAISEKS